MTMSTIPAAAAAILCSFSLVSSATALEVPQKFTMPAALAEAVAKEAVELCGADGIPISASVVNDEGRLVYFYRGEGTGPNTVGTSFRKAYTSASLKAPTSVLARAPEAEGFSQLGKMEDDILLLTGGLPVFHEDTLIGAIGLSGAPDPALEEDCGARAIEAVMGGSGG